MMGLGLGIHFSWRLGEGLRCSRALDQGGLVEAFALEQLTTLFKHASETVRAPLITGPSKCLFDTGLTSLTNCNEFYLIVRTLDITFGKKGIDAECTSM
jgi:hypothetical protein